MQASRQERKEEEEQVEVITYRLVEDLTSVGVNMSEVKKLQDAGFATIGSVLQQPMKELIAIKGFSFFRRRLRRETSRFKDLFAINGKGCVGSIAKGVSTG